MCLFLLTHRKHCTHKQHFDEPETLDFPLKARIVTVFTYRGIVLIIRLRKDIVGSTPTRPTKDFSGFSASRFGPLVCLFLLFPCFLM